MAYTYHHGKRVSKSHATILRAYERKYGHSLYINQGARTIAEQWTFWNHYRRYGSPLAAYPTPAAPHIKWRLAHHALDISAPEPAHSVAAFYRSQGIPVAFNVHSEAWHMDCLDRGKLNAAAKRLGNSLVLQRGARRPAVVTLKKLLYRKGVRNFSGKHSSNRYDPHFGLYCHLAVQRYQRKHGLKADGVVGPSTWRELRK